MCVCVRGRGSASRSASGEEATQKPTGKDHCGLEEYIHFGSSTNTHLICIYVVYKYIKKHEFINIHTCIQINMHEGM